MAIVSIQILEVRCWLNENKQSLSLKAITVWGTRQPLPEPRITAFVEIGARSKQVVHQELDRTKLAWSAGWQSKDHANSGMAGRNPALRRNQAEGQECAVRDLLTRSALVEGKL